MQEPKTSNPSIECTKLPPNVLPRSTGPCCRTRLGKSGASTTPRLLNKFSNTIPERRTRYFDALSILLWYCSSTFALRSCCSSSTSSGNVMAESRALRSRCTSSFSSRTIDVSSLISSVKPWTVRSRASACLSEAVLAVSCCPIAGRQVLSKMTRAANVFNRQDARVNRLTMDLRGKGQSEDRFSRSGGQKTNVSAMVLQDLLCNREPKPDSILFAVTHEWLKEFFADVFSHTRAIVFNTDFNGI